MKMVGTVEIPQEAFMAVLTPRRQVLGREKLTSDADHANDSRAGAG